jgi:hypothetical protein
MFSENDRNEIFEIHNFIRNNLNKSRSNEETVVKYLTANYSITEREAHLHINAIISEWN